MVEKICRLLTSRRLGIERWALEPHPDGLLLSLALSSRRLSLLLSPRNGGPAYAHTRSLSLSVRSDSPIEELAGETDELLRVFVGLLNRLDQGDLLLAVQDPESATEVGASEAATTHAARLAARERLAEQLRWAAYVGYRALILDDLYPHETELGVEVDDAEIRSGWCDTAARIRAGRAPSRLGLYVHVPFCSTVCSYCYCGRLDSFDGAAFADYPGRLERDAERYAPLVRGCPINTLYLGGGTPSLLPLEALARLFEQIYGSFEVAPGIQVLFEGNPSSLSEAKIELLATVGRVSRLTVGVQTLDPTVQKRVNRVHAPAKVEAVVKAARRHGIPRINIDLIAGLPGQSQASFESDLAQVMALGPDSIHINPFRAVPSTLFARGGGSLDAEQRRRRDEMVAWGKEQLTGTAMAEHEESDSSEPVDSDNLQELDLRRHNASILGLGFGTRSHSFGNHYYQSHTAGSIDASLQRERATGEPRWIAVRADHLEEQHKYLVANFGYRFERSAFRRLFGRDAVEAFPEAFADLLALGAVRWDDEVVEPRLQTTAERLTYRVLLYSERVLERSREIWGRDYDPRVDYRVLIEEITGQRG